MLFYLLILSQVIEIALCSRGISGKHWAVLVAGSNGWSNYRHQADVCHAYQLLKSNGIPPENIITMMYDDVAHDIRNPFPGKLFNDYGRREFYEGVKIDYRGENVTSDMFLRVLKGDKELKESGFKVVESGPEDNVFVYFSDHGAPNMITFPNGVLYAKQLNETLDKMNKEKRYGKMLLYIEASNSGSMFWRILPKNVDIFATTAASPIEPSWATFCMDKKILTCLADEFSYLWMSDTEKHQGHLSNWSILEQFHNVKPKMRRSHVKSYGDQNVSVLSVGEFQAYNTSKFTEDRSMKTQHSSPAVIAHLIPLMRQLKSITSLKQLALAERRILRALKLSKIAKETIDEIVNQVTSKSTPSKKPIDMNQHLDCFQEVYDRYRVKCFTIQQVPEVSREIEKFDRLCERGYDTNVIVQAIFTTCG